MKLTSNNNISITKPLIVNFIEGKIGDVNLDGYINSEKNKKLHIKINLNAKFERHKDCYDEEGNLTESVFIA